MIDFSNNLSSRILLQVPVQGTWLLAVSPQDVGELAEVKRKRGSLKEERAATFNLTYFSSPEKFLLFSEYVLLSMDTNIPLAQLGT